MDIDLRGHNLWHGGSSWVVPPVSLKLDDDDVGFLNVLIQRIVPVPVSVGIPGRVKIDAAIGVEKDVWVDSGDVCALRCRITFAEALRW